MRFLGRIALNTWIRKCNSHYYPVGNSAPKPLPNHYLLTISCVRIGGKFKFPFRPLNKDTHTKLKTAPQNEIEIQGFQPCLLIWFLGNTLLSQKLGRGGGGGQEWRSGESTRLPPMWPGFDSRSRRHMWVEFVVGSRPCSEGFSPGSPVFLPPQFNSTWKQWS